MQRATYAEVVEATEQLTTDEREALLQLLNRRLADEGRERVIRSVREANAEYEAGLARPATVGQIMEEIAE
jgi:hypothetical protein